MSKKERSKLLWLDASYIYCDICDKRICASYEDHMCPNCVVHAFCSSKCEKKFVKQRQEEDKVWREAASKEPWPPCFIRWLTIGLGDYDK